jgi:hypothetical protein
MNKGGNAEEFQAGDIKRGGVFTSGQSSDIGVGGAVPVVVSHVCCLTSGALLNKVFWTVMRLLCFKYVYYEIFA